MTRSYHMLFVKMAQLVLLLRDSILTQKLAEAKRYAREVSN